MRFAIAKADLMPLEPPESLASAPLAYENPAFLNSPDGRIVRILSEYSSPLAQFRRERIQDTVVFFGSARTPSPEDLQREQELAAGKSDDTAQSARKVPLDGETAQEMVQYYQDARKLAHLLTDWSLSLKYPRHRFVVTSGGGPGIMEAANRGAYEAGGKTIGLNIRLPFEQEPNRYITPALNFEFHYFFMRKYWFAYLAKALVVFPGGFGTLDEMFEILTLSQTNKLAKKIGIVVYGSSYWKQVINLDALVQKGAISAADRELFQFADTPEEAFALLRDGLIHNHLEREHLAPGAEIEVPEIAHTRR
ncbi:TIGR00730 family Rossman fold protein [Acidobacterium capsulatum]|uniref:AMP nucleosidase n=1 Tax=Acidobacterium capsulatum (strain ATCC 51196 / DSM 11244 / BCRC 80197 / JCM 7670 / NBRC 15755 / NCIMB 13165 / 161) TaxID=240015 RepID=C1F1C1_ACIC5|nr:conserved hypothetical protein [Acidobacterium capsulatum ATCC 51196]